GFGPGERRGALDDAGAPVVGGVVVARHGANPMAVIDAVRAKIAELSPGLPRRRLDDGTTSQVTIVPFYDRSALIDATLGTLRSALWQQILVTALVVLVLLGSFRSAALVTLVPPLAVLGSFVAMKVTGVDANVMALAGIAIAIGTMVDVGIVLVDNVVAALDDAAPDTDRSRTVRAALADVAPAVVTSVLTTTVSFLPVFGLVGSSGRLFRPLAFTKTYAMGAALLLGLLVIPALAAVVFRRHRRAGRLDGLSGALPPRVRRVLPRVVLVLALVGIGVSLARDWRPLGGGTALALQVVFVVLLVGGVLVVFAGLRAAYPAVLRFCLDRRGWALGTGAAVVALGALAWLGLDTFFGWLPEGLRRTPVYAAVEGLFPGLGREDMPPFDEGSFLVMPTTMPHASLGQALDMLGQMDAAIAAVPEVDRVVGKLGRADTALDPAPVSMFETVVTYRPEYRTEPDGSRVRQWRDHIETADDIWEEISRAASLPGLTGAPKLMPIKTRLVMLQSGMRAPMGVRVRGPDLETIQAFALDLEERLRAVPAIDAATVQADRVLGKPYLEVVIDRTAIARHGLAVDDVQRALSVAQGGRPLTRLLDGRERHPVRVRFPREERGSVDALRRMPIAAPTGAQVPLGQLAELRYVSGPQAIKSEDTFPVTYVTFGVRREDGEPVASEVDVVDEARRRIDAAVAEGALDVPDGVSFTFAGTYEQLVETERRLQVLIPIALALVFLLLYLQFRRVSTTLIVFSGVALSVATGLTLVWLYGRPGFLDVTVLGRNLGALFQVGSVDLSVAVWVGVIALVGIATDNGVVLSTFLDQRFAAAPSRTVAEVRARAFEAGMRRLRPCLMTTGTTVIALLPVIAAQGKGSDVMMPMALPVLGGMAGALLSLVLVPVLYAWIEEARLPRGQPPDP
ncbi:MAG TPA: efflux RND transporter permease subunit, partial [Polyangiaceae bacterium LLY-WYZ-14_1]|nr:efflux RND transporter permease subunit [Polyangiaceae bacterium LLY-WYZ-14_1]